MQDLEKRRKARQLKREVASLRRRLAVVLILVVLVIVVIPVKAQTSSATDSSSSGSSGGNIGVNLNLNGNQQIQQSLQRVANWVGAVLFALRSVLAIAFWVSIGIFVYHTVMAKLMPTRFSRVGALMDAVERVKDIIYAAVGLFILLFAIALVLFAAGGGIDPASAAWNAFNTLYVQPLIQAFQALSGAH